MFVVVYFIVSSTVNIGWLEVERLTDRDTWLAFAPLGHYFAVWKWFGTSCDVFDCFLGLVRWCSLIRQVIFAPQVSHDVYLCSYLMFTLYTPRFKVYRFFPDSPCWCGNQHRRSELYRPLAAALIWLCNKEAWKCILRFFIDRICHHTAMNMDQLPRVRFPARNSSSAV